MTATITQNLSPTDLLTLLQSSLTLAAKLPAMLGAIFTTAVCLTMALLVIAKYFWDKNQRETEAYIESKRLELEHNQAIQRIASDYITSQSSLLSQAYKDDLVRYTDRISKEDYASVLSKIAPAYHDSISLFLYDKTQSPELRAQRVIYTITKK